MNIYEQTMTSLKDKLFEVQKFGECRTFREINENFVPRKFPAIRYSADYSAAEFRLLCTDHGTFEGLVWTVALEITDSVIRI